jgi:hypothetical protein
MTPNHGLIIRGHAQPKNQHFMTTGRQNSKRMHAILIVNDVFPWPIPEHGEPVLDSSPLLLQFCLLASLTPYLLLYSS